LGRRQRNKGKVGERQAAALVNRLWSLRARRSRQADGSLDADLVDAVPGLHLEVKYRAAIGAESFLLQAEAESGEDVPVVLMRQNGKPGPRTEALSRGRWMLLIRPEDALRFSALLLAALEEPLDG